MTLSKAKMTNKERYHALLNRQPVDRVLFSHKGYDFCSRNCGIAKADIYDNPPVSFKAQKLTMEQYNAEVAPFYTFVAYGSWEFGGEIKWPEDRFGSGPGVLKRPVSSIEDVYNLKLPDVKTAGCIPMMMDFAYIQEKEGTQIGFIYGSPFTFAANLCGVDTFLLWASTEPDVVHHAMRLMTDHLKQVADYFIDEFGAENVLPRSASPTDGLISPRMYEKYILPYRMELHNYVLDKGVKHLYDHICGEQNKNLKLLAQLPWGDPGILSFGSEVDLLTAGEYFPNDIICGNVEPVIVTTKSPEEVYEACRVNIEKGKQLGHRYIFMGGCTISAATPPVNIYMMSKAAEDFGYYE